MMAEDGSFKIVQNPALPAPAQSTELPNVRWFRAVCQFRGNPLVGILGAHADFFWGNHEDRPRRRVGERIDLVAAIHTQRPSAEEKKWHVGAQTGGDFHE